MNISEWLSESIKNLKSASVPTAKLDAEILLAELFERDRSWIHSHSDFIIGKDQLKTLDAQIMRRSKHEPVAYILGHKEFYGRQFKINSETLQPRPETEAMIELLLEIVQESNLKNQISNVIDVGTGSGCIAITAKLELLHPLVIACDVSSGALKIASENAHTLLADIEIVESDLIADIGAKQLVGSILCCNLPYVPDNFAINEPAKYEPSLALFGGVDGLDFYRKLFEQIASLPEQFRPKTVLTESLESQHEDLADIAEAHNYQLVETKDLIQAYDFIG